MGILISRPEIVLLENNSIETDNNRRARERNIIWQLT